MADLKTRLNLLDEIFAASDVTDVTTDAGVDADRDRVWATPDGRTRILVHAVDHIGRLMCDVVTTMDGRDHVWLKVRHWEHELLVRVLVAAGVVRLDDGTVTVAPYATTISAQIAEPKTAVEPTSEVVVCELAECEQFREWLSGEKADADKRARNAETERDRLVAERDAAREQARVLAAPLKRTGVKARCSTHADQAEPGCTVCRDAEIFRAALDGTEGDR